MFIPLRVIHIWRVQRGGRRYHKVLANFLDGCGWFWGGEILSLALLARVTSARFSVSFLILMTVVKIEFFSKEKSFCVSILIVITITILLLTVETYEENFPKHHFSSGWRGDLRSSVKDVICITKDVRAKLDCCGCVVEGERDVRTFDFFCIRHKWMTH